MDAQTFVWVLTGIFALLAIAAVTALVFKIIDMAKKGKWFFGVWKADEAQVSGTGNEAIEFFCAGFNRKTGIRDSTAEKKWWEEKTGLFFLGFIAKIWKTIPIQVMLPFTVRGVELKEGGYQVNAEGEFVFILSEIQAVLKAPNWGPTATEFCIDAIRAAITTYGDFESARNDSRIGGKLVSNVLGNEALGKHLLERCGYTLNSLLIKTFDLATPTNPLQVKQLDVTIAKTELEAATLRAKATQVTTLAPLAAAAEGVELALRAKADGFKRMTDAVGEDTAVRLLHVEAQSNANLPPGLRTFVQGGSQATLLVNDSDTPSSQDRGPSPQPQVTTQAPPTTAPVPRQPKLRKGNK